jgi:hypothetical protein
MDQAYTDKLDGKISEEFWSRKAGEWQAEEQQIQTALKGLKQAQADRILDGIRILELANKAYFLYLKQTPAEQAKLFRIVLSNCAVDCHKSLPHIQKAIRSDLSKGQK